MLDKYFIRRVTSVGFGVLLGALIFGGVMSHQADAAPTQTVNVSMGKAKTVDIPYPASDILVARPEIADVGILRADRLYVIGRAVGDTNILAFDENGEVLADIAVHVSVDQATLRQSLKEFFPDETIKVRTVNEDIVLTGRVSTPSKANKIRDLAGHFLTGTESSIVDLMSVAGEQQVMLKVKIMEANRAALREFGIETDYKNEIGNTLSGGSINGIAGVGLTALNPFATGSLFFDDNNQFGPLKVTLSALERDGLVNTLAEPNLTAISGEEASFLAGGEFPIPVGADADRISIEFRKFGVSLNFIPVVLSEERMSIQISTEVSTLSPQNGVTLAGVDIPGLSVRRATTTVELNSGGTLMIAGLIQSETANALNGVPGIKDLPILGELFKSKSFSRDESELLIMVTAVVVEPFAEAQAKRISNVDGKTHVTPLNKALAAKLRKAYGETIPSELVSKPDFGYLVD